VTTGWEPSRETRQVFEETMRAKGILKAPAAVPPTTPAVAEVI
jgi:hypothetical protein